MTAPTPLASHDLAVDHQLQQIGSSFRFILDVTPVDADECCRTFLAGDVAEPEFTYRDLSVEPDVAQTMLADVDLDTVEDSTVGALLRNKHRELDLQLSMLSARDTPDFRTLSIELYGGVAPDLLAAARSIIERVEPRPESGAVLDADAFLERAEEEINRYRLTNPDIDVHAEIRHDSTGVMVSGNVLLIGPETAIPADRVDPLLQHEVGTHLVTQVNGSHQPLRSLGTGLAGYDETQEGLAVLAEVAAGGFTAGRLRQLAARVVTVHAMTVGAGFVDCWRSLVDAGFPPAGAFTTVMRVFRAGGLTKDSIYLRGLLDLLGHLRGGGALEAFFLGKFALEDLPLIEDLAARGVLHPAVLVPRWYDDPDCRRRLEHAAGLTDPTLLVSASTGEDATVPSDHPTEESP